MSASKFFVGQNVMMTRPYGKPKPAVVEKLGRKYAHVAAGMDAIQVDLETGLEKNGFGRVFTLAEWDDRARRSELHTLLRVYGFGPVGSGQFKQATTTLEAILDILRESEVAS